MNIVWYDTETTGTSTSFDQILQFAAIQTDADLNKLDRIELRCRVHPHVVPHPSALRVTGMTVADINDPERPCHYDMMRQIQEKLTRWSPSIFVGYNSMRFDERILREALFRTLHSPYLTNTGGNCRADAMLLVQTARAFAPECLTGAISDNGRPSYKLDRLAPANGFAHENAHDALADVEATIHLARCVKERAPACWDRFVHFSSKANVEKFLASEDAVLHTEFFFNKPSHTIVAPFGRDDAGSMLCLNLATDLDYLAALPDDQLATWLASRPRPVRRAKCNEGPSVARLTDVPESLLGSFTVAEALERGRRLRSNEHLCSRLVAAAAAGRTSYLKSTHPEEQLYSAFVPRKDDAAMKRFHTANWPERAAIVERFEDARLRYFGRLLLHELQPDALQSEVRAELDAHVWGRLTTEDLECKWTSLPAALAAAREMVIEALDHDLTMLRGYVEHVEERMRAAPVSMTA